MYENKPHPLDLHIKLSATIDITQIIDMHISDDAVSDGSSFDNYARHVCFNVATKATVTSEGGIASGQISCFVNRSSVKLAEMV